MANPPSPFHLACILGLLLLGSLICAILFFRVGKTTENSSTPSQGSRWAQRATLFGFTLCAVAILCLVLTAANAAILSAHQHKTLALMAALQACFVGYEIDNGTTSPEHDLASFIRNLMGSSPDTRVYLRLADNQKNERGQVLDFWGTPFTMKVLDARHLQICSAGPDKTWQTPDDIALP